MTDLKNKSGRLKPDPKRNRYGCCVPALTGLATILSKPIFHRLYGEKSLRLQERIISKDLSVNNYHSGPYPFKSLAV